MATIAKIPHEKGHESLMQGASPEEAPLIERYVQIIWRRKWIILAILSASILVAIASTIMATRLYTASATLEISRQGENVVEIDSVQPDVAGVDQEFYQTQYSLLESAALIDRIAAQLKLDSDTTFLQAFDIQPESSSLFSSVDIGRLTPQQKADVHRQVHEALAGHVAISPLRGSRIVKISFTSSNPGLSAKIANAWAQAFIRSNFDRKLQSTQYASEYLKQRLDELRGRLEQSERDLVNYATNNRIIKVGTSSDNGGSGEGGTIVDANLEAMNKAYAEAKAERIAAQSRMAEGVGKDAINNTTIGDLRTKREEAASKYADLLTKFEPEYPAAQALKNQIDEYDRGIAREEARIRNSIQGDYKEALQRENQLANAVSDLEQKNLAQRRKGIQYNIYQREVDTNRQLYEGLLQRYKEIGVESGIGPNNISVVDAARIPDRPSSPRAITNLLFAFLGGVFLAGLVVVLIEQMDRKIRSPADLERAVPLPVLGIIPFNEEDDAVDALSDRKSSLAEAYMSVQTALRLATDHGFPRTLMVSSTRSGEGKSLSSLALARSLGRSGKKVILVEADLRSPSVHAELGLENKTGVSNFLSGDDNLDALIRHDKSGLIDAMTAGPVPPDPVELIIGDRFDRLIEFLVSRYDHVIFDSPPVLGLADAPLIAEKVEGAVFVVEANAIGSQNVRSAISRLAVNARRVFGTILTKYSPSGSPFSYEYAYGYGYGEPEPEEA